jgi:hypothetical protein
MLRALRVCTGGLLFCVVPGQNFVLWFPLPACSSPRTRKATVVRKLSCVRREETNRTAKFLTRLAGIEQLHVTAVSLRLAGNHLVLFRSTVGSYHTYYFIMVFRMSRGPPPKKRPAGRGNSERANFGERALFSSKR